MVEPLSDDREPRSLADGRYVLVEPIGQGGMATVWRATDTRLGVDRAIKLLHSSIRPRSARERFEREARLMARLEHPHVVPVHDLGEEGDQLWMVMSLFRRGSVADRVERSGPLAPREAVGVTEGVLTALIAAHAEGVVHRDVKPQNVLIDDLGTPRLGDFGIARVATTPFTSTGAILGTPAFMAPEQRMSSKEAVPQSDLYSAACLLVSILLGELPGDLYHRPSLDAVSGRIPPPLLPFVVRATEFVASDRYADATEALAALRAGASGLPADPSRADALAVLAATIPGTTTDTGGALPTTPLPEAPRSGATRTRTVAAVVGLGSLGAVGFGAVGCGVLALVLPLAFGPNPQPEDVPADVPVEAAVDPPTPAAEIVRDPVEAMPAPVVPKPVVRPLVADPPPQPVEPPPEPPAPTGPPPLTVHVSARPWMALEIDGQAIGPTPWHGPLVPGDHTLVFRGDDRKVRLRRTVRVDPAHVGFCWVVATEEPCPP